MNEIYGYVRVSTKEQNEDRQIFAMKDFGVADKNIFIDKQSGKDFNRPQYKILIEKLKPADTIVFNIKTPHLIQSQTRVQTSGVLATRASEVFCCPATAPFCQ